VTGDVADEADNCSVGLNATFVDVVDNTDPCNIIITRTWSLVDDCGNAAVDQVQTITVQDNIAPTFTAPGDITIFSDASCVYDASVGVTGDVTDEADNCSIGLNATFVDVVDNTDPCNIIITRTWSLVDDCGNAAVDQVQTITVQDNIAPTFTAPGDITIFSDASCVYDASVGVTGDVADEADNCSVGLNATFVDVVDNTDPCNIIISRTWSLVDDCGNAAVDQVQTITVQDNIAPTPICADTTIYLDGSGSITIDSSFVDGGSTDNCGITTIGLSQYTFTCADVGIQSVLMTVTDGCGNTDNCTATVTVEDNIAPTAVCQDIIVQLDATGNATITGADVDNGSIDACGIASMVVSPNTFDCTNVGPNTVILTVTDGSGNSSNCTSTVTIEDNIAPNAVCQDITIQLNAAGNAAITGADIDNGSSDACGIQSLAASPNIFTCSEVGPNNVTLTVTDVNGNLSTCNAIVTVQDITPPTAVCQAITVQLDATGNVIITGADIDNGSNDACGIASLVANPGNFDCTDVGPNTVTLTVMDNNGNISSCITTVTVEDNVAPTALCQDITIQLNAVGNASILASDIDNGSFDACGIQSMTVSPNTFTCANVGSNAVTLTVTDVNGNINTCDAIVTVQDITPPTAICQDITVELDATGNATITGTDIDGGSTDACGIAAMTANPNIFDCTDVGNNVVTLTVTDINGNSNTCTANVLAEDRIAPTALCQNITIQLDGTGNATITGTDIDGGSSDACGIASIIATPNAFTCAEVGPNDVTLTVTDNNGNVNTCIAVVTVEETVPPTISCLNDTSVTASSGSCSIIVNNIAPVANDNCGVSAVIYRLTGATLGSGTDDASGLSFNKGITTVWYKVTDGSGNADSCSFDVTVLTTVIPPDSAYTDNDSVCPGIGNIQLMYGGGVMVEGGQAMWYDDAALTNNIGSGNPLSIPAPAVTTTYYVRFEGSCDTSSAVFTTIQILATSTAPDEAISDRDNMCPGDGMITLSYTGGNPGTGAMAEWYSDNNFTLNVGSGNNLTVPAPLVTTNYFVRYEGICDTTSAASTLVTIKSLSTAPESVTSDRDSLCPGDGNVTLTYIGGNLGSGAIAVWYADTLFTTSIGTGNDIVVQVPDSTHTYYARFEGDCNTSDAAGGIVTILTRSVAPVSATSDRDSVCSGDGSVILSYAGGLLGTGSVAVWYDDASMTSSIGMGNDLSVQAPLNETTYFVRFEGDCDTSSSASTTVYIYPEPAPVFGDMVENACISGPLYRYSVIGHEGSTFTWSISGGTIVSDYSDSVIVDWGSVAGTFLISVTEITINGCQSDLLSLDVTVDSPDVDLGEDRSICEGESVTITPTGNYSYQQWHDMSTGQSYTADTTEMVSITVYNAIGCMAEDSVQVTSYPTPEVNLGNDTTLCGAMSLILDAGNTGSTYLWSTGETTQEIEVFIGEQFISVEVTNPAGCTGFDEIHIQPCSPEEFFASIANTITPNGDNVNDTWQIDEAMAYPDIEIEIFDRWGKLVWRSSRGYTENWDGRNMNGKELPMDSYFYVINLNDGSELVNGTITIMR
jgi:gliding motility-associated-like protein